jgi:DNA-binding Xre family transcriptional regulator
MTTNRTRVLPELTYNQICRFEDNFQKGEGCWEWSGRVNEKGRAIFSVGTETFYAYRFMYKLAIGTDPGPMLVCHKCDNPKCVNPDHLFLGTDADNVDDKVAKGRDRRPDGSVVNTSLRTEDIIAIRQSDRPYAELALQFDTSESNICVIRTGRSHNHVGVTPQSRRVPRCLDDESAVREMRLSDDSLRSLGSKFGIDKATVKKVKTGELGKFSWTDAERDACENYLSSSTKLNAKEVADIVASNDSPITLMERYNISKSMFYSIMRKHGVVKNRSTTATIQGVNSPNSKLTVEQVNEIRVSKDSGNKLAERFGISKKAVLNIKHGKTYQSIPWPEDDASEAA